MAYRDEVKQIAYQLDPDCWVSYSGQPKAYKQRMDIRRLHALKKAQQEFDLRQYESKIARRNQRFAEPIYIATPLPLTDEEIEVQIKALSDAFQKLVLEALQAGTKIPHNDEGCEYIQKLFKEAYDKIAPKHVTITVNIEL